MNKEKINKSGTNILKKANYIFLMLFIFCLPVYASFEDVEIGAKASAMAGAFSGQADGSASIFYNPAGLITITRYEVIASQQKLFMGLSDGSDITRNIISFGLPLVFKNSYRGSMAFGMDSLSLDSLYTEMRLRLGYAYPIKNNIWTGLTINRFSLSYGSDQYTQINPVFNSGKEKSGIGLDVGVISKGEKVDWGLSVQNVNEPDLGIKYSNKVSRKIDTGIVFKNDNLNLGGSVVLAGEDWKVKTGTELPVLKKLLKEHLLLRGGLAVGSRDYRFLSTGFGYKNNFYRIDYSFVYPMSGISETKGSHQFGILIVWGQPKGPAVKPEKKPEEEKIKAEGVGPSQAQGITEPSPEDKIKASKILKEVRTLMKKGLYKECSEKLIEADKLLISDPYVKSFAEKMLIVKNIVPAATSDEKRDELIRQAVFKYTEKDTDAVLYVIYAYQKWPRDRVLAQLYNIISKEFPETAADMRILPGITIVDQLLQDALDFIRSNRFIQAIVTLQRVLNLEPNNLPALTRMGSAYWAMGKKDIARNYWQKVLQLDPTNKEVLQFMKQE